MEEGEILAGEVANGVVVFSVGEAAGEDEALRISLARTALNPVDRLAARFGGHLRSIPVEQSS